MSAPQNPLVRAVTAIATLGTSEIVRAGTSAGKALVKGENVGKALDRDMSVRGRADRLTLRDVTSIAPGAGGGTVQGAVNTGVVEETVERMKPQTFQSAPLQPSPATAPLTSPTVSPAASLRARRNFSTILTSPQGVSDADTSRTTLLGGIPQRLGR